MQTVEGYLGVASQAPAGTHISCPPLDLENRAAWFKAQPEGKDSDTTTDQIWCSTHTE